MQRPDLVSGRTSFFFSQGDEGSISTLTKPSHYRQIISAKMRIPWSVSEVDFWEGPEESWLTPAKLGGGRWEVKITGNIQEPSNLTDLCSVESGVRLATWWVWLGFQTPNAFWQKRLFIVFDSSLAAVKKCWVCGGARQKPPLDVSGIERCVFTPAC